MLANNESPCTVNSFASLAQQGYFNDTKCHRLTTSPTSLAVLQCGDPSGDGTGGPGYQFANEYPTDQYPPDDPALQQPVRLSARHAGDGQRRARTPTAASSSWSTRTRSCRPATPSSARSRHDGLATLDKIAKAGVAGGGDDGPPATDVTIKSMLLD